MKEVQKWEVGDTVVANVTEFNITKDKQYKILKETIFPDCFFVTNDKGIDEAYSQDYFNLIKK